MKEKNEVGVAHLAKGQLLLSISPNTDISDMMLKFDALDIHFHPADNEPISPFNKSFHFPENGPILIEEFAKEKFIGPAAQCFMDKFYEWSLEDSATLQIQIGNHDKSHLIEIDHSISVPASADIYEFKALIASHRCKAILEVKFDPKSNEDPVIVAVPFEKGYTGGRFENLFQSVAVRCPYQNVDFGVSMQIRYLEYQAEANNSYSPFIFIADARVCSLSASALQVKPRKLARADLMHEKWVAAHVPAFSSENSHPLILKIGSETIELFRPYENEVVLTDDYGHTLMLKARVPQEMLLLVNGEAEAAIFLGPDVAPVRLPTKCLRGEIVNISICDLSCSQEFLSLPVLAPRILTPEDVILSETRRPFPTDLTVRANHRYQSLRNHLKSPTPNIDITSLSSAIATLDENFATLKLKPIALPEVANPTVSVIIPAHNKVAVTYYCLCSLLVAHNHASFEVIVVDDASTDETEELEKIVSGIRVIHNTKAQRFIRACNAGVAEARGEYIVLLNNDTEVTSGWLDNLIDAFDRFDNVGLAGSKLLYPDGKLQDAGGIVWGNGNPWNYGKLDNPWDPRFCYARQADYLSGAALMTTRKIWNQIGGLSSYLEPMYFEDTDLAFKVRQHGFTTWFVPSSLVYHFEGTTSGTDTSGGFKRYQEINRPKFKRQWGKAFAAFGKEGVAPDLEKDRGIVGRVLFIDYATPREDRDAGSYAARREIELVQSLGYKVTFLPQNLAHFASYTEELERCGVEVITAPFYLSLAEFIEKRGDEFDAVYITRYYVASDTIHLVRQHAPNAKIILNNADLHFLRELRAALSKNDPSRLAAMRSVRDSELAMLRKADVVLTYNKVEHAIIASHTDGQARVMTCPWVVEIPKKVNPIIRRKGLSFLGSFNHHPNEEGVKWFCSKVMPMLESIDAHFSIYGSGMEADIKALASTTIDAAGFIEEVSDAYDRHRIFIAPMLSGAGIKGKVLGALAHGIPTVLTPIAAEGIGLRSGHDCIIAEQPEEWADAIIRLSTDDDLWESMSKSARSYAAECFSFSKGRKQMRAVFEAVDMFGSL